MADLTHLRTAGVSLVLDLTGPALPRVLHWGADLGDTDQTTLDSLALVTVPPLLAVEAPLQAVPRPQEAPA